MGTARRRRRVYNQEQRGDYLAGFERSGLSQTEFCHREKLQVSTFSLWRRKSGTAERRVGTGAGFAEVRLSTPSLAGPVTLHLPGGARLEVAAATDAVWLGLGLLFKRWHA